MKKYLIFLTCMLFITTVSNAQYKVNKTKYDYKMYQPQVGDPYNPGVAGLTSFLIPGLGQMIAGEGGRGAAFLGGNAGTLVLLFVGSGMSAADIEDGGDGSSGLGLVTVGALGALAVDIWAIVDAVRVSKVNNMAFQDKNKTSLMVIPSVITSDYFGKNKVTPGLSLQVTF
jgi:TM2 domain-containing membrane protein YozV